MSRRKNKRGQSDETPKNSGGWIVTFSDLMSLLLTFFILLFSMSTIDETKFEEASQSIQGVLSGQSSPDILDNENNSIDKDFNLDNYKSGIEGMYDEVVGYIQEEDLNSDVSVNMNEKGVFVDIKEAILFDTGSAEIKDSGLEVLQKLAKLINNLENQIVVEGHTDNIPINNYKYPSNWELSTDRAVSVVRYFSEKEKVDPQRLAAVGYGSFNPIGPNDTEQQRAANRRVNILIIFEKESDDADD